MSTTVAVFDDLDATQRTIDRLDALGLDEGSIHVVTRRSAEPGSWLAVFSRVLTPDEGEVASELSRLGVGDEEARFYEEELDEEGAIIVIDGEDRHDAEVRDILERGSGTLYQK